MDTTWKCKCGENISVDYVECWNCHSFQPGYSTPAEQASEYDRQIERTNYLNDEIERQSRRTDKIQDDLERQNIKAESIMDMSIDNERRITKLIERYELIADILERRLKE